MATLFDLPAELRRQIWNEFINSKSSITVCRPDCWEHEQKCTLRQDGYPTNAILPLLLANRQIHAEVSALSKGTPQVADFHSLDCLRAWLNSNLPMKMAGVNLIVVHCTPAAGRPEVRGFQEHVRRFLFHMVERRYQTVEVVSIEACGASRGKPGLLNDFLHSALIRVSGPKPWTKPWAVKSKRIRWWRSFPLGRLLSK